MVNGRIDKYQFEEGYCQAAASGTSDSFTFCYYDLDHLGNVRQVREADGSSAGEVIQKMNYYPFGAEFCDGSANSSVQKHKYNGQGSCQRVERKLVFNFPSAAEAQPKVKEFDNMHGLNTYDYGARQYNPVIGRWDRMDPLSEKNYSVSPYVYCHNNPVRFVDPDGKEISITGSLVIETLKQLQYYVGNSISLTMNGDNYLCYTINDKKEIGENALSLIKMIDDGDISVNIYTTSKKTTTTNQLFIGGAFMGNSVETDGNVTRVNANQEVNPNVLKKADTYSPSGTFMMHEVSEAYQGAIISKNNGKSSPRQGEGSVYKEAHSKATYQPAVYQRIYNKDGKITDNVAEATYVEWYVEDKSSQTIIQTYP